MLPIGVYAKACREEGRWSRLQRSDPWDCRGFYWVTSTKLVLPSRTRAYCWLLCREAWLILHLLQPLLLWWPTEGGSSMARLVAMAWAIGWCGWWLHACTLSLSWSPRPWNLPSSSFEASRLASRQLANTCLIEADGFATFTNCEAPLPVSLNNTECLEDFRTRRPLWRSAELSPIIRDFRHGPWSPNLCTDSSRSGDPELHVVLRRDCVHP